MKRTLFIALLCLPVWLYAQTNCEIYKDGPHNLACQLYDNAIEYPQGSKTSQQIFLESIKACPTYAPSLHEMSVPYLKRGDFYTWKLLIDRAVKADPQYLSQRGWCLFKFLRDFENAYADLKRLYTINKGQPGYTGDGDYDLRIIMALSQREMGNNKLAMQYFNECIRDHEKQGIVGLFDYLHRGVTNFKLKNYNAALTDLLLETKKYEKLADTYYYLALTYIKLKQPETGIKNLLKAKELYTKTGYHRNDPYCESPDQVYLADIELALRKYKGR
ncbi:hypothetical protein GCM10023149_26870 [Mucilaginibacter gynuensis]|uniref:Tetratricopeptide repeat protein n=1 Tax=Mucilaginibacter gynuensis TaxID=1302236 RepID=A0ABP8GI99_9SPHI